MISASTIIIMSGLLVGQFSPGERFAGARSIGMGYAARALCYGNEAIFLNPAGMSMANRYSIDLNYLHQFSDSVAYPSISIVDSRTSKLAAGLAYSWERQTDSKWSNHHLYLSLAYPLGNIAAIGITTKYMHGGGDINDFNAFTGDVGAIIRPFAGFHIGVIGYNLLDVGDGDSYLPIMLGVGIGYAHKSFNIAADMVTNLDDTENAKFRVNVGAEYLIAKMVPIRAGYQWDEDTNIHRWALGTGFVARIGAIDIGYRQNAHRPPDRELTIALRVFL